MRSISPPLAPGFALVLSANGADVAVVNTADSGPGSLRQAIAAAPPGSTTTSDPAAVRITDTNPPAGKASIASRRFTRPDGRGMNRHPGRQSFCPSSNNFALRLW